MHYPELLKYCDFILSMISFSIITKREVKHMLRIGICDDNQNDIKQICDLAIRFSEEHPENPLQIQAYKSPFDLLDDIEKNGGFDLYLLDIVMPHMTGVTLAKRIRERKEKAEILFLTFSNIILMIYLYFYHLLLLSSYHLL